MLERYRPTLAALDPGAARYLALRLAQHSSEIVEHLPPTLAESSASFTGDMLYDACHSAGLFQCEVVMAVAADAAPAAVRALETFVGHPLRAPEESRQEREKRVLAPVETPSKKRTVSDPRVVLTVAANPRREGTAAHAGYDCWAVGSTVDECIAAGLPPRYVRKDVARGRVTIGEPRR